MTSRPFRGLLGAADVAAVLTSADFERISLAMQGKIRLDGAALIALEGVLAGARRLEDRSSAADVLPAVDGQLDVIERLAGAARGARTAAVGLVSEIHQYLGWLHLPQDDLAGALHHLKQAAVLALEADDPVRLTTALSFQAYAHQRAGGWRQAAALATAAARNGQIYPGLRTYLHFQRAEILACQGEKQQASRLLVQADRLVARLPRAEELPENGYWYVPAFFLGERAFVLDALGERAAARESATACLFELPAEWRSSQWAAERRALAEKSREQ